MTRPGIPYPRISCVMTDKDVLDELLDLFGGTLNEISKQRPHHKQAWRWGIEGAPAACVMEWVKPYMFGRRAKRIEQVLQGWYSFLNDKENAKADRDVRVACAVEAYGDELITLKMAAELYGLSYVTVHKEAKKVGNRM
jgi:hypothetical protein